MKLSSLIKACNGMTIGLPNLHEVGGFTISGMVPQSGWLHICLSELESESVKALDLGSILLTRKNLFTELKGPAILVETSVLEAFHKIARADLLDCPTNIISITGSVGKTTTKEIISYALFALGFNIHKTAANRNGQTGIPETILQRPREIDTLVLETGISRPGEMDKLNHVIVGNVTAVVTNVSKAHGGNFEKEDGLLKEKLTILAGASKRYIQGAAIHASLYNSVPLVLRKRCIFFGNTLFSDVTVQEDGPEHLLIFFKGVGYRVRCGKVCVASIECLTASFAALLAYGCTAANIAKAISNFSCWPQRRLEVILTKIGVTVIDDSYNSEPLSLVAALSYLRKFQVTGKKIAVLGDMLELGKSSENLHRSIAAHVKLGCDVLYTVGNIAPAFRPSGRFPGVDFEGSDDELISTVLSACESGDIVIFKASNSLNFSKIVDNFVDVLGGRNDNSLQIASRPTKAKSISIDLIEVK